MQAKGPGTPLQWRPFRHDESCACSAAAQAQRSQKLFAEASLLVHAQGEHADPPCFENTMEQGNQMNRIEAACALLPRSSDCFQIHTQRGCPDCCAVRGSLVLDQQVRGLNLALPLAFVRAGVHAFCTPLLPYTVHRQPQMLC